MDAHINLPAKGFVQKVAAHANHSLTSPYSWNIFRYIGDYIHLFGVAVLLFTLIRNRSCKGFSLKTMLIYAMIFCTRYLDLFVREQTTYLIIFKLVYILTSVMAVGAFYVWYNTYELHKDTCAISLICFGCMAASFMITPIWTWLEIFWSYSQFLEGFALVPQYIFCYRDPDNKDKSVNLFVIAIGLYRVFYAFNWIYKKANVAGYNDLQSWIGGIFEIVFFVDYLFHQFRDLSVLKGAVLGVDSKLGEVSDKLEMSVFGTSSVSRLDARGLRQRKPSEFGGYDELAVAEV